MSQLKNTTLNETTLSDAEQERWDQLKQRVKIGLDAFFEAGLALWEIHEKRLYRDEFPSWEAYCNQVLGRNRTAALRWIQSAKIVEEMSPIGDILPANEAQARELIPLDSAELRQEAWAKAVELSQSKNQPPTARVVRCIVKGMASDEPADGAPEADGDEQHSSEQGSDDDCPAGEPGGGGSATSEEGAPEDAKEPDDVQEPVPDAARIEGEPPGRNPASEDVNTEQPEIGGAETFDLADGSQHVVPDWVGGILSRSHAEKGLASISAHFKRTSEPAVICQKLLLELVSRINVAMTGLEDEKAGRYIVLVCQKLREQVA